jgi:hypothetical protein
MMCRKTRTQRKATNARLHSDAQLSSSKRCPSLRLRPQASGRWGLREKMAWVLFAMACAACSEGKVGSPHLHPNDGGLVVDTSPDSPPKNGSLGIDASNQSAQPASPEVWTHFDGKAVAFDMPSRCRVDADVEFLFELACDHFKLSFGPGVPGKDYVYTNFKKTVMHHRDTKSSRRLIKSVSEVRLVDRVAIRFDLRPDSPYGGGVVTWIPIPDRVLGRGGSIFLFALSSKDGNPPSPEIIDIYGRILKSFSIKYENK